MLIDEDAHPSPLAENVQEDPHGLPLFHHPTPPAVSDGIEQAIQIRIVQGTGHDGEGLSYQMDMRSWKILPGAKVPGNKKDPLPPGPGGVEQLRPPDLDHIPELTRPEPDQATYVHKRLAEAAKMGPSHRHDLVRTVGVSKGQAQVLAGHPPVAAIHDKGEPP